ncbi:DUF4291 domain-containing protein [Permianibacter fluminis]|uniref:DUF4291 domain-containing protein n=1 Tax=Permianibacter fluminis TaxID=2738515 RepID=UPI002E27F582|nr:DUF4291 domain-containing protein [Permianibacter fluminis]
MLAQFDDDSVVVYQAYRPAIADYAVNHQRFGGEFSFTRMSWVKPNFLWMMYRSGWATKEGQERILALWLQRDFFDELLASAVASSFDSNRYATRDDWATAIETSDVRLQWDPDHDPHGKPLARRAVQLGLRGPSLRRFSDEAIVKVEDITPFVQQQRDLLEQGVDSLFTPLELVYWPANSNTANSVGLDAPLSYAPTHTT